MSKDTNTPPTLESLEENGIPNWDLSRRETGFSLAFLGEKGNSIVSTGDTIEDVVQKTLDRSNWKLEVRDMKPGFLYRLDSRDGCFVLTDVESPNHPHLPHAVVLELLSGEALVVDLDRPCQQVPWSEFCPAKTSD